MTTISSSHDGNDHDDTGTTVTITSSSSMSTNATGVISVAADDGATATTTTNDTDSDDTVVIEDVVRRNSNTSRSSTSIIVSIDTMISQSDTTAIAAPRTESIITPRRHKQNPMNKDKDKGKDKDTGVQRRRRRQKTITYHTVFLIIISSLLWRQVRFVQNTTTTTTTTTTTSSSSSSAAAAVYNNSISSIVNNVHVVVSHCDEPLEWIFTKFLTTKRNDENATDGNTTVGINIKSFTVISKCGKAPNQTDLVDMLSSLTTKSSSISRLNVTTTTANNDEESINTSTGIVQVLELPNVGRCDHSYAFWIQQITMTRRDPTTNQRQYHRNDDDDNDDDDLVLFMKGNDNMYRTKFDEIFDFPTLVKNTIETTKKNNKNRHTFSCGSKKVGLPKKKRVEATNIADRPTLMEFKIGSYSRSHVGAKDSTATNDDDNSNFKSPRRPLGSWLQSVVGNSSELYMTEGYMPICYGGVFMTTIGSIFNSPVQDWTPFVDSLSRGDNIEEGHYMERIWAGLLSPSISYEEQMSIKRRFKGVVKVGAWTGMVMLKKLHVRTQLAGLKKGVSRIIHRSTV